MNIRPLHKHILVLLPNRQEDLRYEKTKKRDLIREAFLEEALEIIAGKLTDRHLYLELDHLPEELNEERIGRLKKRVDEKFNQTFKTDTEKSYWHGRHLSVAAENFTEELLEKFIAGEPAINGRRRYLVTGGAGFIGSNLVDALIERGNQVTVIDNLSTGKREYLNPYANFYEVDICNQARIADIFAKEKFDYVFHLAAQISVKESVADPRLDNQVNAIGSFNIFEACRHNRVKKTIFISTGGALYGDVTEPAKETSAVCPISPYAIHKYTAERYLELFRTEHDLDHIILRLANVYGPRQYKGGEGAAVAAFTHNAVNDQLSSIFGDGSKTRDYIYVGDVVGACLAAMDADYRGEVNIATGRRTSTLDLFRAIEQASGKKLTYRHEKDRPGEVQDSVLDIGLARRILGWEPVVDLRQGIEKTLEWTKRRNAGRF
jgi:UDP-glucose 4-epimerase